MYPASVASSEYALAPRFEAARRCHFSDFATKHGSRKCLHSGELKMGVTGVHKRPCHTPRVVFEGLKRVGPSDNRYMTKPAAQLQ